MKIPSTMTETVQSRGSGRSLASIVESGMVAAALTAGDVMSQPVLCIGDIMLGIVSIDDFTKRAARAPAGDPLRTGVMEVFAAVGGHQTPAEAALVRA
jgi:hypothetical protein